MMTFGLGKTLRGFTALTLWGTLVSCGGGNVEKNLAQKVEHPDAIVRELQTAICKWERVDTNNKIKQGDTFAFSRLSSEPASDGINESYRGHSSGLITVNSEGKLVGRINTLNIQNEVPKTSTSYTATTYDSTDNNLAISNILHHTYCPDGSAFLPGTKISQIKKEANIPQARRINDGLFPLLVRSYNSIERDNSVTNQTRVLNALVKETQTIHDLGQAITNTN